MPFALRRASRWQIISDVEGRHVSGWDDPRMPTIAGYRCRGYTPEAIRDFCERIGVAKKDALVETALLEHCLREDLSGRARRAVALAPGRLASAPGAPASDNGALCQGDEDHAGGGRRRRGLMLTILSTEAAINKSWKPGDIGKVK
jgi:glutamyl/glutaminyl-tRNA synthetase